MFGEDVTDGPGTLSTLGERYDEAETEHPYSLTETSNISDFTEDLVLQDVTTMIDFLDTSEGITREELCNPQLSVSRIMSVAWNSRDGTDKTMSIEVARTFLRVVRETLGANDTATVPTSNNTQMTEANESRTAIEFRSLKRALEILFPWPKNEEMLGVTQDRAVRRQMCEPFVLQESVTRKGRLAGYEAHRHKIWEEMSLEAKKMLTTDPPASVKTLPALLKRGAHQIFWTQCGDLILLWIQAYMWAETGLLSRLDSIKQCVLTGNNCLKRSKVEEESNA